MYLRLLILFAFSPVFTQAQKIDSLAVVPSRFLSDISHKLEELENKLDKKGAKALAVFKKQEAKIQRKLAKSNPVKEDQLFGSVQQSHLQWDNELPTTSLHREYIAELDTLYTGLKFLNEYPQFVKYNKHNENLFTTLSKVKSLQTQFAKADELKKVIQQRKQYLTQQLQNLGFSKELRRLNKAAYYYQVQINQYKECLKDHRKAEKKAMDLFSQSDLFRKFMRKNSQLASLFRISPGNSTALNEASLIGLQNRAQIEELLNQQLLSGGSNAQQINQNVRQAQAELNALKDKFCNGGAIGNGNASMPDGFKPNSQKTKSIQQKLEFRTSFQTNRSTAILPVSSDVGLSVGIKPNDYLTFGIGLAGRVGWGRDIRRVTLTYQGVSIRAFVESKIKGSLYFSGGYERIFQNEIKKIGLLKDLSGWQQSGLIGVSKVVSLRSKLLKKTNMKLLWDFLSYEQVPRARPLIFRIEYSF